MLPRSWKNSLNKGIVITTKMSRCNEKKGDVLCITCNNQVNENKEFEANLKEIKRELPKHFGYKLPYYEV